MVNVDQLKFTLNRVIKERDALKRQLADAARCLDKLETMANQLKRELEAYRD